MGPTQTLLQRGKKLQGKHRRFLESEQKLLAVHLDHLAVPESAGSAVAAVVLLHKSTHTEYLARKEAFLTTVWPIELNLPGQNAVNRIARITGLIEQFLGVDQTHSQAAGQCLNRMQSRDLHEAATECINPHSH